MEKFEIIIAATALAAIIAVISALFFVGWGSMFMSGDLYPDRPQDLPAGATLWDKAEWEKYHGSVLMCGWFAEREGPIVIYPAGTTSIANISFGFALVPGERPHEISWITYTLATRTAMKTVRYGDAGVEIAWSAWNKTPALPMGDLRNSRVEDNELVTVELDAQRLGFGAAELGPGDMLVIAVVPEDDCVRDFIIRDTMPPLFLPGSRMELMGQG